MMRTRILYGVMLLAPMIGYAQGIPLQMNYQGQVSVNGIPFDGAGQFKFALVDDPVAPTTNYWTNDGSSPAAGAEPIDPVSITVSGGKYSIQLGDTAISNMTVIPVTAFNQPGVYLRIWFNDGSTGFQRLSPDRQLTSAPYAYMAERVAPLSIGGENLTRESVWPEHMGRSNTVVTYFTEYGAANVDLVTIPTGKTFVITDVSFSDANSASAIMHASLHLEYEKDSIITVLGKWRQGTSGTNYHLPPVHLTFRAGIPVPEGAVLRVRHYLSSGGTQSCTISGYEF